MQHYLRGKTFTITKKCIFEYIFREKIQTFESTSFFATFLSVFTAFGIFWWDFTTFDSFWHFISSQFLRVSQRFPTTSDSFWQIFTIFDSFSASSNGRSFNVPCSLLSRLKSSVYLPKWPKNVFVTTKVGIWMRQAENNSDYLSLGLQSIWKAIGSSPLEVFSWLHLRERHANVFTRHDNMAPKLLTVLSYKFFLDTMPRPKFGFLN